MFRKIAMIGLMLAVASVCVYSDAAQDKKKKPRTGTVTGELKERKKTPNGKNFQIDVLGVGEEKARTYRVRYDPKIKGPDAKLMEAVGKAKIGDRVRLEWIEGEGFNITAFQVLTKKKDDK